MVDVVSDILFVISIFIIVSAVYKGYKLSLLYGDKKSGMVIIFIVIFYFLVISFSFLAILIAIDQSDILIHFNQLGKRGNSMSLLISSIGAYVVSSKIKKNIVDYCMRKGIIMSNE